MGVNITMHTQQVRYAHFPPWWEDVTLNQPTAELPDYHGDCQVDFCKPHYLRHSKEKALPKKKP